jgi:dynein light chain roadblock-type
LQYSGLISYFAERAKIMVQAMDPTNELKYLRVTSKRHEILVAPDNDFVLIVMQNPMDSLEKQ